MKWLDRLLRNAPPKVVRDSIRRKHFEIPDDEVIQAIRSCPEHFGTYLHDLFSNALLKEGIAAQQVTTAGGAVTGASADMIAGDGLCAAILDFGAVANPGSLGVVINESAASIGPWTAVNMVNTPNWTAVAAAAAPAAATFIRTLRFLQVVATPTGVGFTIFMQATLLEQKKMI